MNGKIHRRIFTLNTVYPHFKKFYVHVSNGNCKQELVVYAPGMKDAFIIMLQQQPPKFNPLSRLRARKKSCWVDWPDGTSGFSCWASNVES